MHLSHGSIDDGLMRIDAVRCWGGSRLLQVSLVVMLLVLMMMCCHRIIIHGCSCQILATVLVDHSIGWRRGENIICRCIMLVL